MKEMGIRVLVDKWANHNKFDAEISKNLLTQADAVWCEWALGNVVWYSQHISDTTPLFVRYHSQERKLAYLEESERTKIKNISFVSPEIREIATNLHQTRDIQNISIIPNALKMKSNLSRKNDNYSIGFVGLVPKSKRLDLAVELLEELISYDSRYHLKVAGNMPNHYSWMESRKDECDFFDSILGKINSNRVLKDHIHFVGHVDGIENFYLSVGHVISTSDFESFHLPLTEGPLHGAAAHTICWEGADKLYTPLWLRSSIKHMAQEIHRLNNSNMTSYHANLQTKSYSDKMRPEFVALSILQTLSEDLT